MRRLGGQLHSGSRAERKAILSWISPLSHDVLKQIVIPPRPTNLAALEPETSAGSVFIIEANTGISGIEILNALKRINLKAILTHTIDEDILSAVRRVSGKSDVFIGRINTNPEIICLTCKFILYYVVPDYGPIAQSVRASDS